MNYYTFICTIGLAQICLCNLFSQDVTPKKGDNNRYSFTNHNLFFEVDPNMGGRITSFKLNNSELLVTGDGLTGSTFWPSPQAFWNWPPPAEIDNLPYECSVLNNKLILKSQKDKSNYISCYKTFYANQSDTSIIIEYVLKNDLISALEWAPWEVTRVYSHGLVFFEKGDGESTGSIASQLFEKEGCIWYNLDKANALGATPKLFSDAKGWIAYLYNRNLFIKTFDDIAPSTAAPGEAEAEIYYGGATSEIENQGAYVSIGGKDSITWKVKWVARKLPDSFPATINYTDIVRFTKSIIKSSSTAIKEIEKNNAVLFPNPAKNYLNVRANSKSNNSLNLLIYNFQGIELANKYLLNSTERIDISTLTKGTYFFDLKQNSVSLQKGKIIVVK